MGAEPTAWICATCGVQHAPSEEPPAACRICEDERQYVPAEGQRWTSLDELRAAGHRNELEDLEPGLTQIRTEPSFAIGQQAYLVQTPRGNVLWDCISYLDEATVEEVTRRGGITAIAISHPHFYASCVEWAHAFGATINLPSADRRWVMRPDDAIDHFNGAELGLVPRVRVIRVGGHFHGSTVLHWAAGAEARGVLLTGDTIATVADPRWVTVMYSYPNRIPLSADEVRDVAQRVDALEFDRLYAGWNGDVIISGAREAVRRSFERYAAMVEGTWERG
jgi:hypothetical protein